MKKIITLLLLLISIAVQAQTSTQIDSTMTVRISEIEVYPEYLQQYLEFAHNVGATSVKEEPGVICIYPMQQLRNECQIRILNLCITGSVSASHQNRTLPNLQARHPAHGEESRPCGYATDGAGVSAANF